MMKRKTVIIGGGASGLFLSSLLPSAILLEKNNEVGKKLLLTGGGKCNLTHEGSEREIVNHYYVVLSQPVRLYHAFPDSVAQGLSV